MSATAGSKNSDSFQYVIKMAKSFEVDEKRFIFVRSQILTFEECMEDGLKKSQTIKSLISWTFKEFVNYKSDSRMLILWKLMGKYSENIGMDGVLENLHRLGFFKTCPDFYLMWADYLGLNENKENFDKVIQLCEENCQQQFNSFECQQLFRPLQQKYFNNNSKEEEENNSNEGGKTLDIIKMLADEPENVRSFDNLTLFQHKNNEKNNKSDFVCDNMSSSDNNDNSNTSGCVAPPPSSSSSTPAQILLQQPQMTPGRKFMDKNIEMSFLDSIKMGKEE